MTTAQERLDSALITWLDLLSGWAASGELSRAATHVLDLDGENAVDGADDLLQSHTNQWSLGDFESLPPIVLLSNDDISGARGAYAASTDTIYLNEDWLQSATDEQIIAVLTEELGAFLDDQLNTVDTQGDEGALFSAELLGIELSDAEVAAIQVEDDSVQIVVDGERVDAEASITINETIDTVSTANVDIVWDLEITKDSSLIAVGTENSSSDSYGVGDTGNSFVRAYDSSGSIQWQDQILLGNTSKALAVSSNSSGKIAVAGYSYTSSTQQDPFLRVYDPTGENKIQLSLNPELSGNNFFTDVVIDSQNFVYVSGIRSIPNTSSMYESYLSKYNLLGDEIWSKPTGASFTEQAYSPRYSLAITISEQGYIYIGGYSENSLVTGYNVAGLTDVFVSKYDQSGKNMWTYMQGTPAADKITSMDLLSDGSLIAAGSANQTVSFIDTLLFSLSPSGNKNWEAITGPGGGVIRDIKVGVEDKIYAAGSTYASFNGGFFNGEPAFGARDAFIAEYSKDGSELRTKVIGTEGATSDSNGGYDDGFAVEAEGNYLYLASSSNGTFNTNIAIGSIDAFIESYELQSSPTPLDPITGELGLPGKVKLKNRGKVPFRLYGSEDIDVNAIDFDSILFGGDPEALMAEDPAADAYFQGAQRTKGKKAGSYIATVTDLNSDGFDDILIKALRSDLVGVMEKGDTEIYAYAQMGEESVLWSNTDTVFF